MFGRNDVTLPLNLMTTVRLPQLLAQSALTPTEVTQVQKLLGDFLRFMQKSHSTFFVQEYEDEEPVSGNTTNHFVILL